MSRASVSIPELDRLLDKVRYVPKRVAHHAQHSGYDVLFAATGMRAASSGFFTRLASWIPKSLAWRLWALRPQPSNQSGLAAEMAAIPWTAMGRGRLCHFIYGEDTFFFTPLWKRGGNVCVATVHYPPQVLTSRLNPGSLAVLDAVIIVGENQREWLSGIVDPAKIHFCPHHVDTDFFCPEKSGVSPDSEFRLLCVGHLFRDYDVLLGVLQLLRTHYGHQVTVDLVGPQEHSGHPLVAQDGVRVHRGISDEALRDLYRTCTVGAMPLTDSTANNALLEMMACGMAIVTSDVGGVRDYVPKEGVVMRSRGDVDGFARAVDEMLRTPAMRAKNGAANRAHAVSELSLPASARKLASIYASALGS